MDHKIQKELEQIRDYKVIHIRNYSKTSTLISLKAESKDYNSYYG